MIHHKKTPLYSGIKVQSYARATRDGKGAVTTTVALTAGETIVQHHNKSLSYGNGGPTKLTQHWARSLLEWMDFGNRKATTTPKIEPSHFDELGLGGINIQY